MNKLYQDLEMEILLIFEEDIITTSPNGFDDVEDDPFMLIKENRICRGAFP